MKKTPEDNDLEQQAAGGSGNIYNYFQGATIHNMVINGNMTRSGTENYYDEKGDVKHEYSDAQVARALEAIVGKGKPIDAKWKWAGAKWLLNFVADFPLKSQDFCSRIAQLQFSRELEFDCDYNNIRAVSTLSFLSENPLQMDKVRYSEADKGAFLQLRSVVQALQRELEKTIAV